MYQSFISSKSPSSAKPFLKENNYNYIKSGLISTNIMIGVMYGSSR